MREALVGEQIGSHVQIVLTDGVRAERSVAGYLAKRQPDVRFEPSAVAIDEGKQADGGLADLGGARGDLVEGGLGSGVQHAVLPQQIQARVLVERDGGLHHFSIRMTVTDLTWERGGVNGPVESRTIGIGTETRPMPQQPTRTARLEARIPQIGRAAARGTTDKAEVIQLSLEDQQRFVDLLLNPPALAPAMKRAKKAHSRLIMSSAMILCCLFPHCASAQTRIVNASIPNFKGGGDPPPQIGRA